MYQIQNVTTSLYVGIQNKPHHNHSNTIKSTKLHSELLFSESNYLFIIRHWFQNRNRPRCFTPTAIILALDRRDQLWTVILSAFFLHNLFKCITYYSRAGTWARPLCNSYIIIHADKKYSYLQMYSGLTYTNTLYYKYIILLSQ